MRVKIEFDCDNAAFEDESLMTEVALVLNRAKQKLARMDTAGEVGSLYDSNGNKIGIVAIECD